MSITRKTHRTVTFFHPFHLPGHDGLLPAGEYDVESIEKLDVDAPLRRYIPLECHVHIWSEKNRGEAPNILTVDPQKLEAALALDSDPMRAEDRREMIASYGGTPEDDAA